MRTETNQSGVDTPMNSTSDADVSKILSNAIGRNVHFETSENMREVANETVQAVITSPPYWNLKDYKHPEQIGFHDSYDGYHERLDRVWSECKRVLRQDGTMWVVIDKIMQTEEITHIPYDITRHCRKLGFLLQDMVVWNKPTAIAGMSPTNFVNKYEHIVFFSKSRKLKLQMPAVDKKAPPDWMRDSSRLTDIWRFPVKAGSIRRTPAHEAPYPEELVKRIVLLSTDEGDMILDPFLGSGTTVKVALQLNRDCIGYEINPDFSSVIVDMLAGLDPPHRSPRITEFS